MRIAVIDCGTNTFHLLIADVTGDKWKFLVRKKRVVKLGSGRKVPDLISENAAARAIAIMQQYRAIIDHYQPDKILTAGTAALRDARNGKTLLKSIQDTSGIKVKLITGEEEALLIARGVQAAIPMDDSVNLVMDIGGGSTEFILCNSKKVVWKHSFRLGAARLLVDLQPSDPFSTGDVKRMNLLLEEQLKPLTTAIKLYHPARLVGASGSFDTFASILQHKKGTPNALRGKTHYHFKLSEYHRLHKELLGSTYHERLKIPGMLRMRADMIVVASLLLSFVLRNYQLNQLELSSYALKEGLLAGALKSK